MSALPMSSVAWTKQRRVGIRDVPSEFSAKRSAVAYTAELVGQSSSERTVEPFLQRTAERGHRAVITGEHAR
jgi:hypothetical protein